LQKKKSVSNGNELKKCRLQVSDGQLSNQNQSLWAYSVESNLLRFSLCFLLTFILFK